MKAVSDLVELVMTEWPTAFVELYGESKALWCSVELPQEDLLLEVRYEVGPPDWFGLKTARLGDDYGLPRHWSAHYPTPGALMVEMRRVVKEQGAK